MRATWPRSLVLINHVVPVLTLTLLPLVLFKLDLRINKLALPWVDAGEHRSPRFAAWGERLWRRPIVWGSAALVALIVLAAPIIGLRTSMPSIKVLPENADARVGYGLVQDPGDARRRPVRSALDTTIDRLRATLADEVLLGGAVAHSGRVIFAAGAVMVAVFFTFVLSGPLPPKEMGVILGIAVLLGAFLVRLVLLPVLLLLTGRSAWACPAWLRRILPKVTFRHA